jgi:hypothetical protein
MATLKQTIRFGKRVIKKGKKTARQISTRKRKAARREAIRTQYRKRFARELVRQDEPITFGRLARQAIHERRSATRIQERRGLTSSFIDSLEYDELSGYAYVYMKNGSSYRYANVPRRVFMAWKAGRATCKTDDHRKWRKRWWIGKTPSLGAFYNQKIKGKYSMVILT